MNHLLESPFKEGESCGKPLCIQRAPFVCDFCGRVGGKTIDSKTKHQYTSRLGRKCDICKRPKNHDLHILLDSHVKPAFGILKRVEAKKHDILKNRIPYLKGVVYLGHKEWKGLFLEARAAGIPFLISPDNYENELLHMRIFHVNIDSHLEVY